MIETENNESRLSQIDDEIDLKEIFKILWDEKKIIIFITTISAIASVIIALLIPNTYTSKALLIPTIQDESLYSQLAGVSSFGGLSSFGFGPDIATKSSEGIERIKSFEFFDTYFLPNIKLENMLAVRKWIPESNTIIYDDDLFDFNERKWVRGYSFPQKQIPSSQEAFETYQEIINISEDRDTSFVIISIEHKSPVIAQKWLDTIILKINESMRQEDAEQAQKSITFLNETARSTNIQSLKEAIASLLENQMQILTLTDSNEEYIFRVIDSPIIPEEESGPPRALICIVITFLGGFLSLGVALFMHYRKQIIAHSH